MHVHVFSCIVWRDQQPRERVTPVHVHIYARMYMSLAASCGGFRGQESVRRLPEALQRTAVRARVRPGVLAS